MAKDTGSRLQGEKGQKQVQEWFPPEGEVPEELISIIVGLSEDIVEGNQLLFCGKEAKTRGDFHYR
ncbi:hypothetical protein QQP08_027146 [Theobroma cacao]|nr:hypothetical protein QQP08_027146 [Theobroma cacao]